MHVALGIDVLEDRDRVAEPPRQELLIGLLSRGGG
jgi:hypothetical protein